MSSAIASPWISTPTLVADLIERFRSEPAKRYLGRDKDTGVAAVEGSGLRKPATVNRLKSGCPGSNRGSQGFSSARVGQLAAIGTRGKDDLFQVLPLVAKAQCRAEPHFSVMQAVGAAHDAEKHKAPVFQTQVGVTQSTPK